MIEPGPNVEFTDPAAGEDLDADRQEAERRVLIASLRQRIGQTQQRHHLPDQGEDSAR